MVGNGDLDGISIVGEMFLLSTDGKQLNVTDTNFNILTGYHKGEEANLEVNEVGGTFTIKVPGRYQFNGAASVFVSAGIVMKFSVFVNGIQAQKTESSLDYKNSQDTNNLSGTGTLKLVKGDVIDIRAKSDTQPVLVDISDMNVNLHRIGH